VSAPILITRPHLVPVVWGSDRLQRGYGKDAPLDQALGEAWEVSAIPGGESGVEGESLNLRELFDLEPGFFLGPGADGARFPMLIKLLATSQRLSVQVHPDTAAAERLEGRPDGKWECWIILEAEPGASIYLGLREGVDPQEMWRVLESEAPGGVVDLMRRIEVRPGELYPVAPGTLHCIGAGITLLEVQQPSDITYRIYDWGRKPGGAPRALHLAQAREVLDAASRPGPVAALGPAAGVPGEVLIDDGPFRIERWRIEERIQRPVRALTALVCLGGEGSIAAAGCERQALVRGRSCVVPRGATMFDLSGGSVPLEVAVVTPRQHP
jgi:mannose-6-phosphate isomerase